MRSLAAAGLLFIALVAASLAPAALAPSHAQAALVPSPGWAGPASWSSGAAQASPTVVQPAFPLDTVVVGTRVVPPFVILGDDGTYSGLTVHLWTGSPGS